VVHWREGFETPLVEALRAWAGLDRSGLRRPERAFVWRISADVAEASELDATRDELLRFAGSARAAWAEAEAAAVRRALVREAQ
jgi:hypothetical protein